MQITSFKTAAMVLAAPSLAMAVPVEAAAPMHAPVGQTAPAMQGALPGQAVYDHHGRGRHRGWDRGRGNPHRYDNYRGSRYDRAYYGEPVYRDTRIWRARDGRYYCRKRNGTTGLLIGAAGGALIGREIAGRNGDRTLGAILGAAGGAILGRAIDRGGSRCR